MGRAGRLLVLPSALVLAVALAACDDDLFISDWDAVPDTVALYSLARPDLELASAYNFFARTTVRIERPDAGARWDLAVGTRDGGLVFLPPGALGVVSEARITVVPGQEFEALAEAPADTLLYTADDPLPVQLGTVYVVRTTALNQFGCSFYAKLEPIEIDPSSQLVRFVSELTPFCNDRRLIPPDDD